MKESQPNNSLVAVKNEDYGLTKYLNSNTIDLWQKSKKFVFVSDIEKLKELMEAFTGLEFHYEIAKDCNYFYHFWLEPRKISDK